jgi:hypothetical protein
MRLAIYDRNPGKGFGQWCLRTSWVIGCWLFKLFGAIDDYIGVGSREEVYTALAGAVLQNRAVTELQYWGHGSRGFIYISGQVILPVQLAGMLEPLAKGARVWFRTCSTFQGAQGQNLAVYLANRLGIRVAGHTRIIGLLQGGLHSLGPGETPSWSVDAGEVQGFFPRYFASMGLWPGEHTVVCLATRVPEGW